MSASSHGSIKEALERLTEEAAEHLQQMGVSAEALERIKRCLLSSTQSGNMFRSRTVVQTGLTLCNNTCTAHQLSGLHVLACLIDFSHAAYCMWDDIMDSSSTHHGQPCWYRQENVGRMAINNGCLLKSIVSLMVTKHFMSNPCYVPLIEMLNEAWLRTELGQNADIMTAAGLVPRLAQLTEQRYRWTVEHKTAHHSIYLPLALPFLYLGLATPEILRGVHAVAMVLGLMFQARDDFLHVYGSQAVTGKMGTDISQNKCTWLAVEAVKRCDERQRGVLESCYGSQDAEDVRRVKEVFDELDLQAVFVEWNAHVLDELSATVRRVCAETGAPKAIFEDSLSRFLADARRDLAQTRG
ncbi:isoprenoid synthase domain-containing protein [Aspergillus insuetus]